jgi:hypothetical protein
MGRTQMKTGKKSARESSVRSLEELYTVVAGLAIAVSALVLIDTKRAPLPLRLELLMPFFTFLVTLVPFYHGSIRHLDATYIEHDVKDLRTGALLADFSLLFLEVCILLGVASLVSAPQFLPWGLIVLWLFDSVWGLKAFFGFSHKDRPASELIFAVINFLAAVFLLIFLRWNVGPPGTELDFTAYIVVFFIALGRSGFDYSLNWDFYFPKDDTGEEPPSPRKA